MRSVCTVTLLVNVYIYIYITIGSINVLRSACGVPDIYVRF